MRRGPGLGNAGLWSGIVCVCLLMALWLGLGQPYVCGGISGKMGDLLAVWQVLKRTSWKSHCIRECLTGGGWDSHLRPPGARPPPPECSRASSFQGFLEETATDSLPARAIHSLPIHAVRASSLLTSHPPLSI